MGRTLAQKMGVRSGHRLLVLDAPDGYPGLLQPPEGVRIETSLGEGASYDGIHVFVRDRADVEAKVPPLLPHVRGGLLWVCYPKRSGGIPTDISRDHGWEALGAAAWDAVAQVAVDADWSALRFRPVADVSYTPGSKRTRAGE
ncbi:hypothetical protein O4J56_04910 [Nocardiopsis sp. RSe5-2]|uniref:DUF3052 domain-containing protein n=1 Tax=Nocardiopsis endophytica TaxID=3018445 RepID=A0ABT4TZ46_9ACTN|nr:hypothetical protein [Nocardiopsis endophytica]MDA2809969.1 hypothetical protein [Nocardiopsis endophytica]